MHALGNNYIYVNVFAEPLAEHLLATLARRVSDVRRGIGSDGLILMGPSERAPVRMRIFNADGSESETCGNGLRCVAKYAFERGLVSEPRFQIETGAGLVEAIVHVGSGLRVDRVTINMGAPSFGPAAVGFAGPAGAVRGDGALAELTVADRSVIGTLVSMGNPHFVTVVQNVDDGAVASIGPLIETHSYFPNRLNVEFVRPVNRRELDFRVWERGSGITYACGSGACASVAAGVRGGWLDDAVTVHLLGGDLEVGMRDGNVWMTGDAVEVFDGEFHVPDAG